MLYDQPQMSTAPRRASPARSRSRPFRRRRSSLLTISRAPDPLPADDSVARTGATVRQGDWRDELLKTGIRGKAGQRISFARLEPLPGMRWLHAEGETRPDDKAERRWLP